jgi:hypothetical protein
MGEYSTRKIPAVMLAQLPESIRRATSCDQAIGNTATE